MFEKVNTLCYLWPSVLFCNKQGIHHQQHQRCAKKPNFTWHFQTNPRKTFTWKYCSQINYYTLGWQNVIKPAVQYGKQRLGAKKNHQICKTAIRTKKWIILIWFLVSTAVQRLHLSEFEFLFQLCERFHVTRHLFKH